MSCLIFCAFKKDLIAFTATHGYEISEEQFTPFHPVLIITIENVHVIVNEIVRCFDVSQLIESLIDKIRFPVAQGHPGKFPRTFACFCFWRFYHLPYPLE
jgi:hypothetical protein